MYLVTSWPRCSLASLSCSARSRVWRNRKKVVESEIRASSSLSLEQQYRYYRYCRYYRYVQNQIPRSGRAAHSG